MPHNFLDCIQECLATSFKESPSCRKLVEESPDGKQEVELYGGGQKLIYRFDKGGTDLYPYLSNNIEGLKSIADYVVFTHRKSDNAPYILIFELKKKKDPAHQLKVTKMLCTFIMSRIEAVKKLTFRPQVRMIGLIENYKGPTNVTNLKYDRYGILRTQLRRLKLEDLLK